MTRFPVMYSLSVAPASSDGTVTGSGIDCPGTCTEEREANTAVDLAATPAANYQFAGWSGDSAGTGACNHVMDGHKTVSASFTLVQHSLLVEPGANGSVSSSPAGIDGFTSTASSSLRSCAALSRRHICGRPLAPPSPLPAPLPSRTRS
jgi:trimeric autotransporter adhesin